MFPLVRIISSISVMFPGALVSTKAVEELQGLVWLWKMGQSLLTLAATDVAAQFDSWVCLCSWTLDSSLPQRKPTHLSFVHIKGSDPEAATAPKGSIATLSKLLAFISHPESYTKLGHKGIVYPFTGEDISSFVRPWSPFLF